MPNKNIFPEQDKLEQLREKVFITNIVIMILAMLIAIGGFLFMVWATVILLRFMGVLA